MYKGLENAAMITKILLMWAVLSTSLLVSAQQFAPCVAPYPGEDGTLQCATNCSGTNGQTSVETQGWEASLGSENLVYNYIEHSFSCGTNNATQSPCASLTYYQVVENNVGCGFCPDCGNANCTNYSYNGCCDQTNGALECAPGICSSCNNTCIEQGTSGTECCSSADCASGLTCIGSPLECTDCSNSCNNSSCPNYDYCTCNPSDPSCSPTDPNDPGNSGSTGDPGGGDNCIWVDCFWWCDY